MELEDTAEAESTRIDIVIYFQDDSRPYDLALNKIKREVSHIEVDGITFVPCAKSET